jgi:hypothetical protein
MDEETTKRRRFACIEHFGRAGTRLLAQFSVEPLKVRRFEMDGGLMSHSEMP